MPELSHGAYSLFHFRFRIGACKLRTALKNSWNTDAILLGSWEKGSKRLSQSKALMSCWKAVLL